MVKLNANSFQSPEPVVEYFLSELRGILASADYELDIIKRKKTENPSDPFTTENTMIDLNFDTDDVKNELVSLNPRDYLENILDDKDNSRPPFWVFKKEIQGKDVYIKIKIRSKQDKKVLCMSFHYPRYPLKPGPYA